MKAKITVNQMLDKLLTKYSNTTKPDSVVKLQQRLIELKVQFGGNTFIDDYEEVLKVLN